MKILITGGGSEDAYNSRIVKKQAVRVVLDSSCKTARQCSADIGAY